MNHANLDPALRINLLTPQSQAKGLAVSKYAYKEHKKKGEGKNCTEIFLWIILLASKHVPSSVLALVIVWVDSSTTLSS